MKEIVNTAEMTNRMVKKITSSYLKKKMHKYP